MKIMVTGAAGFIGSQYVRNMLAGMYPGYESAHVTAVDKLTYAGTVTSLPMGDPRLTFVRTDICDDPFLPYLMEGHDAVVHFAAETHVDRSLTDARQFVLTNVVGTQQLLEGCLRSGVPRMVHVSTDEVYGSQAEGRWDEDAPLHPNSPYAASKAAAEMLVRSYCRTHGLDVSITRSTNTYGPYQLPDKIIPLFVTNLLDGQMVPLYGDGRNVREWLHVDDHCRAIQLVLDNGRPEHAYNVAGGTALTNSDLTKRLLRLCGQDWNRVRYVEDRKGHDLRYAVDGTKLREELGFTAAVPLESGLADTVRWYTENRWWWEPLRERAAAPAGDADTPAVTRLAAPDRRPPIR